MLLTIKPNERTLMFRDGAPVAILEPGRHRFWFTERLTFKTFNIDEIVTKWSPELNAVLTDNDAKTIAVTESEVGLVTVDGLADRVLTAGKYIVWTNRRVVSVEVVNVEGIVVEIPEVFLAKMPKPETKVVEVRDAEIALVTVDGLADRVLTAGKYVIWQNRRVVVEVVNVEDVVLAIYDAFWEKLPADATEVVEVRDSEVALVTVDGLANRVLTAGKYVLWTSRHVVSVKVVSVKNVLLDIPDAFWAKMPTSETTVLVVRPFERTLVYVDGKLELTLAEGRYLISRFHRSVAFNSADLRERELQVGGQEVMTADKVSIRINLMMKFRVVDPVKAAESVDNLDAALYAILQIAARNFIAGVTVDGLLESRDALAQSLFETVSTEAEKWGVETIRADLKDIVLPGDMKLILNQVIAAEKQAQANLIMRREETAATRSLANTAKMFEKNPMLLRLKELEAMQNMAAGVENLTVVAGKDKLLNLLSSD